MRPVRLEMEGFSSFRQKTDLVFEDCDLFVLTGRTGSGKSSIIDAITFALYGSISRLDRAGAVAPVINQGSLRARVSFTFRAGGRDYTIAREVPRKGTTKVVFEREGESLGTAVNDVKRQIEALLGLTFEQFTKCVVLPQGDFADFLHAGAGDRQDLLVKLLDAELFRRVQKRASERAIATRAEHDRTEADVRREQATVRARASALGCEFAEDALSVAQEDEAVAAGTAKVGTLGELVTRIAESSAEIQRLSAEAVGHSEQAANAIDAAAFLEGVRTPNAHTDVHDRLVSGQASVAAAQESVTVAEKARDGAEVALAALPSRDLVAGIVRLWGRQAEQQEALSKAETSVGLAASAASAAITVRQEAEARFEDARLAREQLLQRNHAFAAARGLKAGDTCPICGQVLSRAPVLPPLEGMKPADTAVAEADGKLRSARELETAKAGAEAVARERLASAGTQLAGFERELEDCDDLPTCNATLARIDILETSVETARTGVSQAKSLLLDFHRALDALEAETAAAWTEFQARANECAALGSPPHRRENDLAASWASLEQWAAEEAVKQAEQARTAAASQAACEGRARALGEAQRQACLALGVAVAAGQQPLLAANTAEANAKHHLEEMREAIVRRRTRDDERKELRASWQTADALNRHLHINRFEQWYLEEALKRLLVGASTTLRDLSAGQYSLKLDENRKDFLVVDHTNADESRPVKTLSGGETFLASLALALALADEIALLAPATAPKLEALFLDEGFGTLDPDTLDTVAAAIEELGARGRMVGIVTHVRELAERVPVRFHVTKTGGSSRIERER